MATENQRWLVVLEQWVSSGSCYIVKSVTDKYRKNNKNMTNTDYAYCSGICCKLRNSCRRYLPNPPDKPLWWVDVAYNDSENECKNFIR